MESGEEKSESKVIDAGGQSRSASSTMSMIDLVTNGATMFRPFFQGLAKEDEVVSLSSRNLGAAFEQLMNCIADHSSDNPSRASINTGALFFRLCPSGGMVAAS